MTCADNGNNTFLVPKRSALIIIPCVGQIYDVHGVPEGTYKADIPVDVTFVPAEMTCMQGRMPIAGCLHDAMPCAWQIQSGVASAAADTKAKLASCCGTWSAWITI